MKIVGLTGGIGMGKSTAASALRRAGVPVFDADAAVHRLQAPGGRALPAIADAFPGTVCHGVLDRAALRTAVLADRARLRQLEAILHPLVRAEQRRFWRARGAGARLAVRAVREESDERVCEEAADVLYHLAVLLAGRDLTLADAERVRRADVVIRTGLSRFHAVRAIRRWLASGARPAPGANHG